MFRLFSRGFLQSCALGAALGGSVGYAIKLQQETQKSKSKKPTDSGLKVGEFQLTKRGHITPYGAALIASYHHQEKDRRVTQNAALVYPWYFCSATDLHAVVSNLTRHAPDRTECVLYVYSGSMHAACYKFEKFNGTAHLMSFDSIDYQPTRAGSEMIPGAYAIYTKLPPTLEYLFSRPQQAVQSDGSECWIFAAKQARIAMRESALSKSMPISTQEYNGVISRFHSLPAAMFTHAQISKYYPSADATFVKNGQQQFLLDALRSDKRRGMQNPDTLEFEKENRVIYVFDDKYIKIIHHLVSTIPEAEMIAKIKERDALSQLQTPTDIHQLCQDSGTYVAALASASAPGAIQKSCK